MSVLNTDAGITTEHIAAIEQTCRETNTFILVRPSTKETMQLIGEGYATKSMDIHHKSSDWGPASGFVPCDPAFSKALTGAPNPTLKGKPHGAAQVVTLSLTEKLANPRTNPKLEDDPKRPSTATERYVKAAGGSVSGAKSKTFKLVKKGAEWEVSWMNGDTPVPLQVFGYRAGGKVVPVTGDYDLWMVAPHISRWSQHTQVMGIKDSHGESGATMFITYLLRKLNEACGRSDNHVFHHGAESQNYGFTQAIDNNLVMFSPGGSSEMVNISDLPAVLVDMQSAGYLVYWNKRYGERDPELMGSAFHGGVSDGGLSGVEGAIAEAKALREGPPSTGGNSQLANELRQSPMVQKALLGRGGEAGKIQSIKNFHKALTSQMEVLNKQGLGRPLQKLQVPTHIPQSVKDESDRNFKERHALQQQLQAAVIKLSEMDRGFVDDGHHHTGATSGAALAPDPAKWDRWRNENRTLFMKLEKLFGSSETPLHFERITGTRAYKVVAPPKTGEGIARLIREMGLK